MKIVLDTHVLVRSHPASEGPARRTLLRAFCPSHIRIISRFLRAELERILVFPRIAQTLPLTPIEINQYIRDLIAASRLVVPDIVPLGLLRDQEDAPVLRTALAGHANVL